MSELLSEVYDDVLTPKVNDVLVRILGKTVTPAGKGGWHRVAAWGTFDGHQTEAMLRLAGHPKGCGALVIADDDAERALYLDHGLIVGSSSSVLFELLGRVLYQSEVVTHEDADALIEVEESGGAAALGDWLPEDVLSWAVRTRVATVTAALPYIRKGQFAWVQGEIDLLGLPTTHLEPAAVVAEARQRYEAWRAGEQADAARDPDTPSALAGPLQPKSTEALDPEEIYRRIRETDLGFR